MTINSTPLEGFTIYSLEMKTSFFDRYVPTYSWETWQGQGTQRFQTLHFADEEPGIPRMEVIYWG